LGAYTFYYAQVRKYVLHSHARVMLWSSKYMLECDWSEVSPGNSWLTPHRDFPCLPTVHLLFDSHFASAVVSPAPSSLIVVHLARLLWSCPLHAELPPTQGSLAIPVAIVQDQALSQPRLHLYREIAGINHLYAGRSKTREESFSCLAWNPH